MARLVVHFGGSCRARLRQRRYIVPLLGYKLNSPRFREDFENGLESKR
jgi:hypothetical protein